MAKITHGGPSYNEHELNDPDPPLEIKRFQLGDDDVSLGDNSPPSGRKEYRQNDGETAGRLWPAQTTENPSGKLQEEGTSSTARSTDGNGQSNAAAPSDEVPPYEEWKVPELKEECRVRGLPVSGTHDELVNRLYDHDVQEAEAQGD